MSAFQGVANLIVVEANLDQLENVFFEMWKLMQPGQKLKLMKTDAVRQLFPSIDLSKIAEDDWINTLTTMGQGMRDQPTN